MDREHGDDPLNGRHCNGWAVTDGSDWSERQLPVDASHLTCRTLQIADIPASARSELFGLFSKHYDDVDLTRFESDFTAKDFALVLEYQGRPVGFTTARLLDFDWHGESIAVLYSGDTIVDRPFWGQQELARTWLAQIGRLARRQPGRRMVWFLIVKGHRTYRYLPVFAREFVPTTEAAGLGELSELRDAIAAGMFGSRFDPVSGTIRFAAPQSRLRAEFAEPTPRELNLPGVGYFLSANPGFRKGDELACLCELSPGNMRTRARRWFDEGWNDG
jgi:hypothetical protein